MAQSGENGILPLFDGKDQVSDSILLTGVDYNEYLQYQIAKQQSSSSAHSGNSFACLTSSLTGPLILDSDASDHISGNKSLFSSLVSPPVLSKVTLANGSQILIKGIGEVKIFPSIPLTTVLFTPECPYNLILISKLTKNLNCSITFTADSVVV